MKSQTGLRSDKETYPTPVIVKGSEGILKTSLIRVSFLQRMLRLTLRLCVHDNDRKGLRHSRKTGSLL